MILYIISFCSTYRENIEIMLRKVALAIAICLISVATVHADVRDDVKVAAPWEISGTDPATDGYIFLRMGVMETLVDTDKNGALTPGLATDWSNSQDGLLWTFNLRQASFHDGSALTAEAVVAALSRAISQPGPLSKAPVDSVTACLLYTSPSPRDLSTSRMPSSA